MDLNEINWDFNQAGTWPFPIKLTVILLVCVLVAGAWVYYDTLDQSAKLEQVQNNEVKLKQTFEAKQRKAANLEAYKQQLKDMQEQFGAMLQQLPSKTEIAELLVDVSQTGLASGLEFELFQPLGESRRDFYAEKPIRIRVSGTYHEFGAFVSGLAALPRIVTLHNVTLTPRANSEQMTMSATAKTYRYLDEGGQ